MSLLSLMMSPTLMPMRNFDTPVRLHFSVALGHATLNVDGAADCVDHADELHQHSIARRFDDSAAMFGDLGVDELLAVRLELAQCAFLIDAHQPAVAGNIASENRRQPAIDSVFGHLVAPGNLQLPER
jgi:hypothetical protein